MANKEKEALADQGCCPHCEALQQKVTALEQQVQAMGQELYSLASQPAPVGAEGARLDVIERQVQVQGETFAARLEALEAGKPASEALSARKAAPAPAVNEPFTVNGKQYRLRVPVYVNAKGNRVTAAEVAADKTLQAELVKNSPKLLVEVTGE